jgi:hypothetical protein
MVKSSQGMSIEKLSQPQPYKGKLYKGNVLSKKKNLLDDPAKINEIMKVLEEKNDLIFKQKNEIQKLKSDLLEFLNEGKKHKREDSANLQHNLNNIISQRASIQNSGGNMFNSNQSKMNMTHTSNNFNTSLKLHNLEDEN